MFILCDRFMGVIFSYRIPMPLSSDLFNLISKPGCKVNPPYNECHQVCGEFFDA